MRGLLEALASTDIQTNARSDRPAFSHTEHPALAAATYSVSISKAVQLPGPLAPPGYEPGIGRYSHSSGAFGRRSPSSSTSARGE